MRRDRRSDLGLAVKGAALGLGIGLAVLTVKGAALGLGLGTVLPDVRSSRLLVDRFVSIQLGFALRVRLAEFPVLALIRLRVFYRPGEERRLLQDRQLCCVDFEARLPQGAGTSNARPRSRGA